MPFIFNSIYLEYLKYIELILHNNFEKINIFTGYNLSIFAEFGLNTQC